MHGCSSPILFGDVKFDSEYLYFNLPTAMYVIGAKHVILVQYAYYLPIYFQSVQGVSTTQSGVRFIALVLPQIVGLVVTGALVSQWGYYVSDELYFPLLSLLIKSNLIGPIYDIGCGYYKYRRWTSNYDRPYHIYRAVGHIYGHQRTGHRYGTTTSVHSIAGSLRVRLVKLQSIQASTHKSQAKGRGDW